MSVNIKLGENNLKFEHSPAHSGKYHSVGTALRGIPILLSWHHRPGTGAELRVYSPFPHITLLKSYEEGLSVAWFGRY